MTPRPTPLIPMIYHAKFLIVISLALLKARSRFSHPSPPEFKAYFYDAYWCFFRLFGFLLGEMTRVDAGDFNMVTFLQTPRGNEEYLPIYIHFNYNLELFAQYLSRFFKSRNFHSTLQIDTHRSCCAAYTFEDRCLLCVDPRVPIYVQNQLQIMNIHIKKMTSCDILRLPHCLKNAIVKLDHTLHESIIARFNSFQSAPNNSTVFDVQVNDLNIKFIAEIVQVTLDISKFLKLATQLQIPPPTIFTRFPPPPV